MFCVNCRDLRSKQGGSSLTETLNRWVAPINRALERQVKETFTKQDLIDANSFANKPSDMLTILGRELNMEAVTQINYVQTMSSLHQNMQHKNYNLPTCGKAPGMNVVFKSAAELCSLNPKFQSSLVVSLLKAAVAKATSKNGNNERNDVQVLNFIRLIGTYDKKAAKICRHNLGCFFIIRSNQANEV